MPPQKRDAATDSGRSSLERRPGSTSPSRRIANGRRGVSRMTVRAVTGSARRHALADGVTRRPTIQIAPRRRRTRCRARRRRPPPARHDRDDSARDGTGRSHRPSSPPAWSRVPVPSGHTRDRPAPRSHIWTSTRAEGSDWMRCSVRRARDTAPATLRRRRRRGFSTASLTSSRPASKSPARNWPSTVATSRPATAVTEPPSRASGGFERDSASRDAVPRSSSEAVSAAAPDSRRPLGRLAGRKQHGDLDDRQPV